MSPAITAYAVSALANIFDIERQLYENTSFEVHRKFTCLPQKGILKEASREFTWKFKQGVISSCVRVVNSINLPLNTAITFEYRGVLHRLLNLIPLRDSR